MKKPSLISAAVIIATNLTFSQGTAINNSGAPADSSALLDLSSTTQGFVLPRMTQTERNAIKNPTLGLQVFNTTTNCINMWLGTTWKQSCFECDFNAPTASNNGPLCVGDTLYLSATTTAGATYNWTGPNGFSSTLQNPAIENVSIAAGGSYYVSATLNGCTCNQQTTYVTVNAIPNPPVISSNSPINYCKDTIEFTASSIAGATYNWTGPDGFTSSLQNPVIPDAQAANGGTYYVTATVNSCISPPESTNVTVNESYAAITLTNNQTGATETGFQQKITINSNNYISKEMPGLENILFSTDACNNGGSGTALNAWCESGCTDNSTSTVWWVNLGNNTIAGSGGTLTIYMNFMEEAVMSSPASNTGKAPELTATYGQYDNGATVFSIYDNFAGTVISPAYRQVVPGGTTLTQNNGISISTTSGTYGGLIHLGGYNSSPVQIFDGKVTAVGGIAAGMALQIGNSETSNSIDFNYWNGSVATGYMYPPGMTNANNPNLQISTGIMGGAWIATSSQVWYKNYAATSGSQGSISLPPTIYPSIGVYHESPNTSVSYQWIRTHIYPPSGVMPGVSY